MDKVIKKGLSAEFESIDDERAIKFIVSSESIDRDDDIIRQDGIDLETYKKNPIVLYNHNRNSPIARASEFEVKDGKLTMKVFFPKEGISKLSDEVYGLLMAGVLNATSIGFLPKSYGWIDQGETFEYREVELLELSIVTIPANPDAVAIERSLKESVEKPGNQKDVPLKFTEQDKNFIELEGLR